MLSYCFKCQKSTESKNPKAARTKISRIMLLSKYEVCDNKNSKLIKPLEASRLLSSLRTKTLSGKIPLVGPLLFY